MVKSGSGGRSRRVSNGLVALSSAAVLGVYSAGYLRTRPAAARFALSAERRSPAPVAATEPVSLAPKPAPIAVAEPPARAVPTLSPVSTRAANQPSRRRPPTHALRQRPTNRWPSLRRFRLKLLSRLQRRPRLRSLRRSTAARWLTSPPPLRRKRS